MDKDSINDVCICFIVFLCIYIVNVNCFGGTHFTQVKKIRMLRSN